jgi:putative membrane protein
LQGFALRLVINVLGLWLASQIVTGMTISGTGTFIAAALLLGVVNALVRPLFIILTLPFTIATLGLFLLVVNAAMLALVAWFLKDFQLADFGSAFFASLIVSLTSWVSSWYVGPRAELEVHVQETRGLR